LEFTARGRDADVPAGQIPRPIPVWSEPAGSGSRSCELQLKLDELIRATESAHTALLNIEELSERELDQIKVNYQELARGARQDLREGKSDLGRPEIRDKKCGNSQSKAETY